MEAVGQLSGGIAHDFNNLMMIVLGNLEAAGRHASQLPNATNMMRALANATRGAQRAAALTSRLLAFSRRQPLDPKPLDVTKFISGSVDFLQRSLGETIRIEAVVAQVFGKSKPTPTILNRHSSTWPSTLVMPCLTVASSRS